MNSYSNVNREIGLNLNDMIMKPNEIHYIDLDV